MALGEVSVENSDVLPLNEIELVDGMLGMDGMPCAFTAVDAP